MAREHQLLTEAISKFVGEPLEEAWPHAAKHFTGVEPRKVAGTIKSKGFADYFRKHFDLDQHVTHSPNYSHAPVGSEEPWHVTREGINTLRRSVHSHFMGKWGHNVSSQVMQHVTDDDLLALTNNLHAKGSWKPVAGIKD